MMIRRVSLGSLGARFLGAVLLMATWAKAVDPGAFAEQIRLEQLDFFFSAGTVTLIALAVEAGLGTALFLGVRRLWVLVPSTLLVIFFLFLTGRNYWLVANGLRDANAACGCFGTLLVRTPAEALWQDLLLLVPPLLLAYWGGQAVSQRLTWLRLVTAAVMVVSVTVYAGSNSDLKFVDMAAEIAQANSDERFVQTSEYLLVMEGSVVADAEIYHSEGSVTFLILSGQLSQSILLRVRTGTVETIAANMISRGADGSITLVSDAVFDPQGRFELGTDGISFTVEQIQLHLKSNSESTVWIHGPKKGKELACLLQCAPFIRV